MHHESQPEERAIAIVVSLFEVLLSPNLTVKQEQFDNVSMNASEEPANRSFLPSEEDIIPPQNQLPNLTSGRPIACPHQKRTRSMKSIHDRRLPRSRPYLEAWWEDNRSDRYPTKEVVSDLAAKENLKFDQVKGWFVRRRKRMAHVSTSSNSIPGSDNTLLPNSYTYTNTQAQALSDPAIIHDLHAEDLPGLEERETSLSLAEKLRPCSSTSPIEQYAMTPPREECSTIQTPISVQNDGGPPRFTKRPTSNSNIRYSAVNGPTVLPQVIDRESGTALGPDVSFSTTSSLHASQDLSVPSSGKPMLPHRQKGKKIAPQKQYAPERQARKIFQCTRCNFGYQFASDWARHLEIHEPQQHWTCMLQGETVVDGGKLACPFCGAPEPTQDHLIEHNVSQCADMTHKKRTFQRRDHMLSHMKRIHNSSVQNPPEAWMTVVHEDPNQQFWCGFCREFLRTTWDSRLKHLSSHFKVDNLDMTKWAHERIYSPSMPDKFARLVSPAHSVDPARSTGSINPTSGFHPLNSTPPMNSPLLAPGSPVGPPGSTAPAPPTSPIYFMDFDHPLDPYYPTGARSFIDPALLSYLNDDPIPEQLPFFEGLGLDLEIG